MESHCSVSRNYHFHNYNINCIQTRNQETNSIEHPLNSHYTFLIRFSHPTWPQLSNCAKELNIASSLFFQPFINVVRHWQCKIFTLFMKHDKGVTYPKSARSLDLWMENITRLHAESRHRNYMYSK